MPHLDVTQEAGARYFGNPPPGPVVMLNLLRFREVADYSAHQSLAPDQPISGEEAYQRYGAAVLPLLQAAGSEVIFAGKGGEFLIGPEAAGWDQVLLVRHRSAAAFLAFATDEAYRAVAGHRSAALEDSRLLPLTAGVTGFSDTR